MGDDGQTGHQAKLGVGNERRGNQDAVGEVVHAVAHQDHPAGAPGLVRVVAVVVVMAIAFVVMRVTQDCQLFQQEERQQAGQQRGEQTMGIGF